MGTRLHAAAAPRSLRLLPDDDLPGIVGGGQQLLVEGVADRDDASRVAQELVDARPGVSFHVEEDQGPVLGSGHDAGALVIEDESGEEGAPKNGRRSGGERPKRSDGTCRRKKVA